MMWHIFVTAVIVALTVALADVGLGDHPEGEQETEHSVPTIDGLSLNPCSDNEYQFWGTHEEGCNGLREIEPGHCICGLGLYRRELDGECVAKADCRPCVARSERPDLRETEMGCSGPVPIRPGECVCNKGLRRREEDRRCINWRWCPEWEVVDITVDGKCSAAPRLCQQACPAESKVAWSCLNAAGTAKSPKINCACTKPA